MACSEARSPTSRFRGQHRGLTEDWIFAARTGELHHGTPLTRVLERACKALGIKRITTHGLRHTANDLLRRTTSDVVTRAIVGHAAEAMSRHYSHVGAREKQDAARAAFSDVIASGGGRWGDRGRRDPVPRRRTTTKLAWW